MTKESIEEMRAAFESEITSHPVLSKSTPLGVMKINGEFDHYMNNETDTLWLGFALGCLYAGKKVSNAMQG